MSVNIEVGACGANQIREDGCLDVERIYEERKRVKWVLVLRQIDGGLDVEQIYEERKRESSGSWF